MYFSDAKNFRLRLLVMTFCIDYHTFLDSKKCYCYRQNVRDQQDIKKNVMFKNCMFYFVRIARFYILVIIYELSKDSSLLIKAVHHECNAQKDMKYRLICDLPRNSQQEMYVFHGKCKDFARSLSSLVIIYDITQVSSLLIKVIS